MNQDIVVDLPVDPPWVDEKHYTECEDRRLFQCPECKSFVEDTKLNICECSLKECVCGELSNERELE